jgi:hypothetical protein
MGLSFHTAGQSNSSAWRFDIKDYQKFQHFAFNNDTFLHNIKWEEDCWTRSGELLADAHLARRFAEWQMEVAREMIKQRPLDAEYDQVVRETIAIKKAVMGFLGLPTS